MGYREQVLRPRAILDASTEARTSPSFFLFSRLRQTKFAASSTKRSDDVGSRRELATVINSNLRCARAVGDSFATSVSTGGNN